MKCCPEVRKFTDACIKAERNCRENNSRNDFCPDRFAVRNVTPVFTVGPSPPILKHPGERRH